MRECSSACIDLSAPHIQKQCTEDSADWFCHWIYFILVWRVCLEANSPSNWMLDEMKRRRTKKNIHDVVVTVRSDFRTFSLVNQSFWNLVRCHHVQCSIDAKNDDYGLRWSGIRHKSMAAASNAQNVAGQYSPAKWTPASTDCFALVSHSGQLECHSVLRVRRKFLRTRICVCDADCFCV